MTEPLTPLTGDQLLEAHSATGMLEEVLQSVTAQALRMGRIEDAMGEVRGSFGTLQHSVEQLGIREAASMGDGNQSVTENNVLLEHMDGVERLARQASRRSAILLFVAMLQMVLIGGLIGQSYLKLAQYTPPPPPPEVVKAPEPVKPPEPAFVMPPPPAPAPAPDPKADKLHGRGHHGKK